MSNRRFGVHSGKVNAKSLKVQDKVEMPSMITIGMPAVQASGGFPNDTSANTEQAAAFAKVSDGGVFANLAVSGGAAGYTANYQLFPDTEVVDDAVYFGKATKFGAMEMDMSATVQTYSADALVWEYFNGDGWITFTPYDETDGTAADGKRSFGADGNIFLDVGKDWTLTTIDSQSAYWVRARVTAATITQIGLTDSKEHLTIALSNGGTVVNVEGNIGRGIIRFETVSGANNDTEILLVNMTKGHVSGLKTLTKALIDHEIADFDVDINKGDSIAIYCVTEDGTTEFAGGILELNVDQRG